MSGYDQDLLAAALKLLSRAKGRRGPLPGARIRRSVSTSYYALFHFLLDEVGRSVIGVHNDLLTRRRAFIRVLAHSGMKAALEKVRGTTVDPSVEDFLRPRRGALGKVPSPTFARDVAVAFVDAQAKRHDADYDLNKALSETDARLLRRRVKRVIAGWRAAKTAVDKDFKHALCLLMLVQGRLR